MQLEVYKKSDFYEDYISSQKEYYERENADAYFAERLDEKDKVIAELENELQAANEQIENLINSASRIMLFQDNVNDNKCAELRHNKYKRCLAMAKWCHAMWILLRDEHETKRSVFYWRWWNLWNELAEKFEEAK